MNHTKYTIIHEWTITFTINGELQTLTIWADSLDTAKDQIEINHPARRVQPDLFDLLRGKGFDLLRSDRKEQV